jgi:hypothetical protein
MIADGTILGGSRIMGRPGSQGRTQKHTTRPPKDITKQKQSETVESMVKNKIELLLFPFNQTCHRVQSTRRKSQNLKLEILPTWEGKQ